LLSPKQNEQTTEPCVVKFDVDGVERGVFLVLKNQGGDHPYRHIQKTHQSLHTGWVNTDQDRSRGGSLHISPVYFCIHWAMATTLSEKRVFRACFFGVEKQVVFPSQLNALPAPPNRFGWLTHCEDQAALKFRLGSDGSDTYLISRIGIAFLKLTTGNVFVQ